MSACPEGRKGRGGGWGLLTSARLAGSQERRGPDVSDLLIHKWQRYLSALEREHGHKRRVLNLNKFLPCKEEPQLSEASDTKKGLP